MGKKNPVLSKLSADISRLRREIKDKKISEEDRRRKMLDLLSSLGELMKYHQTRADELEEEIEKLEEALDL